MATAEQLVLRHKLAEALCCILMLESYARPAEAIALTTGCIADPVAGGWGLLAATSLLIRDRDLNEPPRTGMFDASVALDLPPSGIVGTSPFEASPFEAGRRAALRLRPPQRGRAFTAAADAAGLGPLQACLYSLRHRGASHDKAGRSRSPAAIQWRGGWRSFESVRRYEKHAMIGRELQMLGEAKAAGLLSQAARREAYCASSCAIVGGLGAGRNVRSGSSSVALAPRGRRREAAWARRRCACRMREAGPSCFALAPAMRSWGGLRLVTCAASSLAVLMSSLHRQWSRGSRASNSVLISWDCPRQSWQSSTTD